MRPLHNFLVFVVGWSLDFCLYLYCNETDTNCRFLREVPDAARWDGMLWAGACVFCRFSLIVEPSPVLFLSPCLDLWWCA